MLKVTILVANVGLKIGYIRFSTSSCSSESQSDSTYSPTLYSLKISYAFFTALVFLSPIFSFICAGLIILSIFFIQLIEKELFDFLKGVYVRMLRSLKTCQPLDLFGEKLSDLLQDFDRDLLGVINLVIDTFPEYIAFIADPPILLFFYFDSYIDSSYSYIDSLQLLLVFMSRPCSYKRHFSFLRRLSSSCISQSMTISACFSGIKGVSHIFLFSQAIFKADFFWASIVPSFASL